MNRAHKVIDIATMNEFGYTLFHFLCSLIGECHTKNIPGVNT